MPRSMLVALWVCVSALSLGVGMGVGWLVGGVVCSEQAVLNDVESYYTSSGTCYNKDDNDWYEVIDNG